MKASFDNTVSILAKAWLAGTLVKGNCCACAVGNICAAALGAQITDVHRSHQGLVFANWSADSPAWQSVFCTRPFGQTLHANSYAGKAKEQIDATGYSWRQLARIEKAFETASNQDGEAAEFAGLMAVVDVLADMHGIDLATAEVAKGLFVKEAA